MEHPVTERLAASSRRTNREVITIDKTMKCQFLVFSYTSLKSSRFRDAEMAASIHSVLIVVVFAHIALLAHVPRALDTYIFHIAVKKLNIFGGVM